MGPLLLIISGVFSPATIALTGVLRRPRQLAFCGRANRSGRVLL